MYQLRQPSSSGSKSNKQKWPVLLKVRILKLHCQGLTQAEAIKSGVEAWNEENVTKIEVPASYYSASGTHFWRWNKELLGGAKKGNEAIRAALEAEGFEVPPVDRPVVVDQAEETETEE